MKLFDYLCDNHFIVNDLIKLGVIPVDIDFKIRVYTRYLEYRQRDKRMESIYKVAADFNNCDSNIYKIVKAMEQTV